jgi:hypothetical protein
MLSATGTLEGICREIALHFFEARAVPVAQSPIFVEESNLAPLTLVRYEVGALDRVSHLEDTPQIRISKPPEDTAKLIEKLSAVVFFGRLHFPLALCVSPGRRERDEN